MKLCHVCQFWATRLTVFILRPVMSRNPSAHLSFYHPCFFVPSTYYPLDNYFSKLSPPCLLTWPKYSVWSGVVLQSLSGVSICSRKSTHCFKSFFCLLFLCLSIIYFKFQITNVDFTLLVGYILNSSISVNSYKCKDLKHSRVGVFFFDFF